MANQELYDASGLAGEPPRGNHVVSVQGNPNMVPLLVQQSGLSVSQASAVADFSAATLVAGANQVVSAATGKSIRVLGFSFTGDAADTYYFQSVGSNAKLSNSLFSVLAGEEKAGAGYLFQTAQGEALAIVSAGSGHHLSVMVQYQLI